MLGRLGTVSGPLGLGGIFPTCCVLEDGELETGGESVGCFIGDDSAISPSAVCMREGQFSRSGLRGGNVLHTVVLDSFSGQRILHQ